MAVASSSSVDVEPASASPSKPASDAAAQRASSSAAVSPLSADASPDHCDSSSNSSAASQRDAEIQSAAALRSEEYRQLFRLPPEEVLVEDFNCACQENILVQGHMYLFVHYICFYSNIFGFETKKIIHFRDITSVKRAKTAGIFPNAIEIFAGGKKHFFASFLSRDEAFKLIVDGWVQHGNGAKAIMENQDSASESSFRDNGVEPEKVKISEIVDDIDTTNRREDTSAPEDSNLLPTIEDDNASTAVREFQDSVEPLAGPVLTSEPSSPAKSWAWKLEDSDAPEIPECYTKVAETTFQITVEKFFSLFFSDDAVEFMDSFHKKCGDKEFKCPSWLPHDQFGHARNVSFQHPIKIYLGAKFGSCQETQKFRVYKNSHLVIKTSQEIADVPYGDHFRVEGLWDVRRDGNECCVLSVYINVAFSKKTMFRGQIVRSTLEECREAYAIWVDMAHELLRKRSLEQKKDKVDRGPDESMIQNREVRSEREANTGNPPDTSRGANNISVVQQSSNSTGPSPLNGSGFFRGNDMDCSATLILPMLGETMMKLWSYTKSQTRVPLLLAISFAVILLMQLSIVVLLTRPQNIHVISQTDYIGGMGISERPSEVVAWLEKRVHHLKDEMAMVESRLERMQWEHARLKEQLRGLQLSTKQSE
ncbi:protein VASCULAR ASSOCIATED DEATH 1, chloroplastic isoform X1 [Punica granatum]|uniref:Protein VASCULAR ASSOCIATED DEATH 1, chloroplastic isoform X1 n=1 Tax=Punica granatum TaxID=22663 RepID=A0A6P8DF08_PUNGR|nr:protein VASCULAR ASSOCIATED DEATH 1, chloroplastic isoform X1 [Punica granatum]